MEKTIPRQFSYLRKFLNIDLESLGKESGVTPSHISLIENRKRNPKPETKKAIIRGLKKFLNTETLFL